MTPYYDHKNIQIYLGDCRDILPELEPVDLVLTSPPYNLGNAKKGSFYGGKTKGESITYLSYSDDMPDEDYKEWQHQILNLCFDRLSGKGCISYNHKPRIKNGVQDDRRNLIPFEIRQEIIWDRCGMVNFSGSFFASSIEKIFLIAKPLWKPNQDCIGWGEVWRCPPESNTEHPAPFPMSLAKKIVLSCSPKEGIVLDPFMGSGTTLVACKQLGRKAIGIELEEKYVEIAIRRLSQEMLPFNMPVIARRG